MNFLMTILFVLMGLAAISAVSLAVLAEYIIKVGLEDD